MTDEDRNNINRLLNYIDRHPNGGEDINRAGNYLTDTYGEAAVATVQAERSQTRSEGSGWQTSTPLAGQATSRVRQ